jgi:mannose-1-phosphate guanylyltransferase
MEAIILAGGFGTRLRPFTFTRAKSLLPILNKPMITYILNSLPPEVDTVILAVNYRRDQIQAAIDKLNLPQQIIVNQEPQPLGTGGAVKFAEHYLTTDRFFVLNADIIASINLETMLNNHIQKHAEASISLWPVQNVSEYGVVKINNQGKISYFVEKPKPQDAPSNLINAGAYLLERTILDYIEPGKLISMEKEIFPRIIKDTNRFYGYQFPGYWIDVGRISSYLDVNRRLLADRHRPYLSGKKTTIQGNATDSCLGDNVTVKAGATIDASVLFNGVTVGPNSTIRRCVLGEHCTIGDGAILEDVAVGDHETVAPHSKLHNTIIWTQPIPHGYPAKQIGNVLGE